MKTGTDNLCKIVMVGHLLGEWICDKHGKCV